MAMWNKKELDFLDHEKNRLRFRRFFYVILLLLLLIDPFVHKHGHFPFEDVPGFYAVYGFIACVGLIFAARLLRRLVKRKEEYYD